MTTKYRNPIAIFVRNILFHIMMMTPRTRAYLEETRESLARRLRAVSSMIVRWDPGNSSFSLTSENRENWFYWIRYCLHIHVAIRIFFN